MSICNSGIENKVFGATLALKVSDSHPLLQLANSISWDKLLNFIIMDLKTSTKKGKWWLGRKLKVRIHLAIYILQQMFNKTDRQMEYDLKDNAAYRIFCGEGIVENWHCPDHTKIEEFRSRLSPETQRNIANAVAVSAAEFGFADPSNIDIDSTVQEANMTYPSQAKMLVKLAVLSKKLSNYILKSVTDFFYQYKNIFPFTVELKAIKTIYRNYVFGARKDDDIKKKQKLKELFKAVTSPICTAIGMCQRLEKWHVKLPWNIKRAVDQMLNVGKQYLDALGENLYLEYKNKLPLSLNLENVSCFNKGKLHKKYEFGRAYQIIRLGGNFAMVLSNTSVKMEDKHCVEKVITEHQAAFGEGAIYSATADKGYYSSANEQLLLEAGVKEIGITRPCKIKKEKLHDEATIERLQNRRSGIEPIIGHIKHKGQLGRSRMKSDRTTLASGYSAVLGFNLRQMVRYQAEKMAKVA
jgi:transposase, IS5 family